MSNDENVYKHPWIIVWGELFSNRYKPQKQRLNQFAWNLAWVHLTIILWDRLLRFLIFSPKAEIWGGWGGGLGGEKCEKIFFFFFPFFLSNYRGMCLNWYVSAKIVANSESKAVFQLWIGGWSGFLVLLWFCRVELSMEQHLNIHARKIATEGATEA